MRKVSAGLFSSIEGVVGKPNGGGRKRLFPENAAPATFELAEATPTSTGTLIATYRPGR